MKKNYFEKNQFNFWQSSGPTSFGNAPDHQKSLRQLDSSAQSEKANNLLRVKKITLNIQGVFFSLGLPLKS